MMRKPAVLGTLCLLLPACSGSAAVSPSGDGAPPHRIGMPNPASAYCIKVGGTLEIRKEADGSRGYCHLPDGRVIEEWTLYRSAAKAGQGN
ncbi:putative hemolysin [Acetobacter fallax]|uniref:DUF333 domain-containing protein n=1 Tax=Acetobacter fallax TaxID=1737473 RepID=A0ABX0K709_9PROT|nr:DUF333 domain-containing protein [Acetobacter fallax]NHO32185.1 DUF333 domain-containing protein [Acetobacter fallax]NHO35762.1 DUF333 domain-containing protein [Acetobacter fallax]